MYELPKEHFERVMPLFDTTQPNSTMIFSTLAGRAVGRVFVDDLDQPTSSLVTMGFQGFSFTHAAVDEQWLHETVAALRSQMTIVLNWPLQMDAGQVPPAGYARVLTGHEFMSYHPQGDLQLPPGRQLRRIDAELFTRCTWYELMMSAFGSVENFVANGIGMCVMDGDEICSEAYAAFLGAGKFEIGIVTNEKYRKQGNAYLACKGLLQLVEETGYPPHWSYFENNIGSAATARKLGFGAERDYQWFHYPIIQ